MSFGAHGEHITVYIKVNILLVKTRQVGFQLIAVAFVLNVGLEFIKHIRVEESKGR